MSKPQLIDFLSPHSSQEELVVIKIEPNPVYLEEGREANYLNFDFFIRGLTAKNLLLKFLKVAVYDERNNLIDYKYLNHNAVGTPGIHTIHKIEVKGREKFDLLNPFHRFSSDMPIDHLRYMFTFMDQETTEEFYYGNIVVKPHTFQQQTRLQVPLKGMMTILDGHDYFSHHRRFEMTIVREFTAGRFASNFNRYGLDFVLIGDDGNLSQLGDGEHRNNYDFHFENVRRFYTHEAPVYAPADGVVVDVVNHLDDLYDTPFNIDQAARDDRIAELAGNYVIIQHNPSEFSHLFHLLKGSVSVSTGQQVQAGQQVGLIGFSGAATTYSHLHYQLMDGKEFLTDQALPCKFSNVTLLENGEPKYYAEVALDTSDFILNY
jgi:hypothetical protein